MSWQALVGLALTALVDWLLGRQRDAQAEQNARDVGAADAAVETQTVTTEIADEQVRIALDRPDDVDRLAAELRARAFRLGAGGGGPVVPPLG